MRHDDYRSSTLFQLDSQDDDGLLFHPAMRDLYEPTREDTRVRYSTEQPYLDVGSNDSTGDGTPVF